MNRSSVEIIAATFSTTPDAVRSSVHGDYRPAVYLVAGEFFSVSPSKPKQSVGTHWRKHEDQGVASHEHVTLWVCDEITPEGCE
jgi:hypothetical protein